MPPRPPRAPARATASAGSSRGRVAARPRAPPAPGPAPGAVGDARGIRLGLRRPPPHGERAAAVPRCGLNPSAVTQCCGSSMAGVWQRPTAAEARATTATGVGCGPFGAVYARKWTMPTEPVAHPPGVGPRWGHEQRRLRSGIRAVDLRPRRVLGRTPPQAVDWITEPTARARRLQPAVLPLVPRRHAQHLLQRPRPARARRPRRPGGARPRQPGHRHRARPSPTPSCSTRWPRFAGALAGAGRRARATAWSSTCRWSPRPSSRCSPARGSARCTRSSSAGSRPHELAARIDDAKPKVVVVGVLRHRAEPRRRVQADAGRRARAAAATSPSPCVVLQREQAPSAPSASATSTGGARLGRAGRRRRAGRLRRGRRHRPALHPLHLRHDRPAQGHRARQRRPRRRAALVDGERLRRAARATCGSPPPTSAGSSATPTSSTRRCSTGAHHRAVRGQAGRHARRGRVLAGRSREHGVKAHVHRADRLPGDQEGGPGRRADGGPRPVARCARCSSPASASTPTPTSGPPTGSACPSSTTGGRPRPAGRSRPTCAASSRCRSRPGRRRCRVPGLRRAGARRRGRRRSRPGTEGAICIRLPLPPGTLPTLWQRRRALRRVVPVGLRRLLPHRRRRATSTRTATSTSWAAPTTCSTSPGTGCRPGSIEAALAGHPRSPSAPSSASPTSSRARCRAASSCSRPASTPRRDGERISRRARAAGARRGRRGASAAPGRHRRRRCPRPARARSCARRCARSPTARYPTAPATIEDASVLDALASVLRPA